MDRRNTVPVSVAAVDLASVRLDDGAADRRRVRRTCPGKPGPVAATEDLDHVTDP